MSHRIAIFFAAAVIGILCLATDASARGGSGGGGKGGAGQQSKAVPGGVSPTGGPNQGGAATGARYYAPPSYNSNAVCGRYPYPPCKR
jgi:hypothetical protein